MKTKKAKPLFTTEQVEGTPIVKITKDNGESFAVVGNDRVTEIYKTKEELEEYIGQKTLEFIFSTVISYLKQATPELWQEK